MEYSYIYHFDLFTHQIQNMQDDVGQIVKSKSKVGQIEKFGEM